jgi:prolipoprotein diacylglyceryltransferase
MLSANSSSVYTGPQMRFALHPLPALHPVFETLGYAIGFAVYRRARSRVADPLQDDQRWSILAAAAIGALLGTRVLGILEQLPRLQPFTWYILLLPGGKTIVGGLLGGWLMVEIIKGFAGIHTRTGDLFALPLCVGIAVGRIGCFLAGLSDDTFGKPTALPWGVDFGDGIPRHPTQLYEIAFLLALACVLAYLKRQPHREGGLFRIFIVAYLLFRFAMDFLKPQPLVFGLNYIQWACLAALSMLLVTTILSRENGKTCHPT